MTGIFLQALKGETPCPAPVWLMRQAGRYLPEYRGLRKGFPHFLDFCFNEGAAVEATLQPIERFDFDAAVIFSDILTIPHALGQRVDFVVGDGPKLAPMLWQDLSERAISCGVSELRTSLAPVYAAISSVRRKLAEDKAVIGFAGGPWTLACYMLAEGRDRDFFVSRRRAWDIENSAQGEKKSGNVSGNSVLSGDSAFAHHLINPLADLVAEHLILQVEAGADGVQLFESWSSLVLLLKKHLAR